MTAIQIRRATADDERRGAPLFSDPPLSRPGTPSETAQLWVATDESNGRVLGAIHTPRAGERILPRSLPGELEATGFHLAPGAEEAAQVLLDHVVSLARTRYAARVIVDAAAEAPWVEQLVRQSGFEPAAGRHAGLYILDLTSAPDGTTTRVLDNPALASLNGHHARFAERRGEVSRYQLDVSPWTGIPDSPTSHDWADVAALLGPGGVVSLTAEGITPPPDWPLLEGSGSGVQMNGETVQGRPDPEVVELTPEDVPEMLAHIEKTKPGPFLPRTIELGRYIGIRRDGHLIAMAGERLHPPGWVEISAVATDPAFRGLGLATRLVLAVAHGIQERGEKPFLHAAGTNTNAIRLYEQLGFRIRQRSAFHSYRIPEVN